MVKLWEVMDNFTAFDFECLDLVPIYVLVVVQVHIHLLWIKNFILCWLPPIVMSLFSFKSGLHLSTSSNY